MAIDTRTCKCGRSFDVNDYDGDDHEERCAVCMAYGSGGDSPPATHLEEAKLQELADIKVALREIADLVDKWRP